MLKPRSLSRKLAGRTRLALLAACILAVAIAVPVFAANSSNSGDNGGVLLSTVTSPKPSGLQAGDVMIASVSVISDTVTISTPTGWTLVTPNGTRVNTGSNPRTRLATYWKVADAGDVAATNFSWSLSGNAAAYAGIARYDDVVSVSGSPIANNVTNPPTDSNFGQDQTPDALSVNTTAPGQYVTEIFALADATGIDAGPTGMNALYNQARTTGTNPARLAAYDVSQAATGASPTPSFIDLAGNSQARYVSQTLALKTEPTELGFGTSSNTGVVNGCLGPIRIQTRNSSHTPVQPLSNQEINVSTDGAGAFYENAACNDDLDTADRTILTSQTQTADIYYKPTARGSGIHSIAASAAGAPTIAPAAQNQTVNKANQTITFAQPTSPQTYGDSFSIGTATSDSGLTVDVVATNGCTLVGSTATMTSGVTNCTLTASQTGNNDYNAATNVVQTVVAQKRQLTGTFTADNKEYDGTTAASVLTRNVTNKVGTDDVNHTGGTATFANENVATGKTVSLTGATLTGTAAGNYTLGSVTDTTADITAKNLTINGAVANNKEYNGNNTATVNFGSATLQGVVAGDTDPGEVVIDSTGYGATFNNENVGTGKAVTVTGVALSGTRASNYTVSQPSGLTANITAKNLTVNGASADNKEYDGDNTATVDFSGASLVGVIASDTDPGEVDLDTTGYGATFDDKNVGDDKPVTVTGVALSGTRASNYTVSQPTGLDANITAKDLTVDGAVADNKEYDGTDDATVDFSGASLVGVVTGDDDPGEVDLDTTGYEANFNNKNVDTGKAVTVTGVDLSGTEASNYTVSQPTGLTADITAKDLTVSGASANNKEYDGNDDATVDFSGASLVGVVAGDTDPGEVDLDTTGYAADFNNENVGTGKAVTVTGVDLSGTEASNYTVSQPTGLTANITAKDLTINGASANNRTYDATDDATVDFSSATLQGVVASDTDPGEVDIDSTGYSANFDDKNVGDDKPVTVTGVALSGTRASNYTVSQPTGLDANISKKDTTGSFTAQNKVYDGTTAATVTGRTVDAAESGDTVTLDGAATFADADVGPGKTVSIASPSLGGTDAGNYNLTTVSTDTADITQKGLTVTGASANNKEYNGDNTATVNFGSATLQGVVAGDTDPGEVDLDTTGYGATFNNENAGTGKAVTVTGVDLSGTRASNYTVSQPSGLTANITAKNLTLPSAAANDKPYDGNNTATVNYGSLSGVVASDTDPGEVDLDLTNDVATFNDKNVGGNKPVTVTGVALTGTRASNYTVSQPTGLQADITQATLDVDADDMSKTYGATDPTFTWTYSGFATGDNAGNSGITGSANCTRAAGETVAGGPYDITCAPGGLSSQNYAFNTGSLGQLTITKKALSVNAADKSKVYGASDPAFTWAYSGFASGDNSGNSGITGAASCSREAGSTVAGSPYNITCAAGTLSAPNYSFTTGPAGQLTITKKSITGSFTAADKDFDGTTAATITGRSVSGEVAGDLVGLVGGTATFADANPGVDKPVTGSGFALAGPDSGNYTLSSVGGTTATINQRPPAGNEPPTEEDIEQGAADELGGPVKSAGLDFGGMAFGFAPDDQGKKLDPTNQPLFAIGCVDDCDVAAKKTVVLTTGDGGASAAATKKLKLKAQNLTLAAGELGVVKLKLTKKQKKAIKKAKKAKLVVKTTVTSDGGMVSDKKAYKLKT